MRKSVWSRIVEYLFYGVVFCALILVPWMVVDGLIQRMPFATALIDKLGAPRALAGLLLALPTLVFLGWLLRGPLWGVLQQLPLVGRFLVTTNRIADSIAKQHGARRDLCVWVSWPNATVRTVGIVTGRVKSQEGEQFLSISLFPTAGNLRGGMLRIVSPDEVVYPGWTVDEAIAFVSTGGTLAAADEASSKDSQASPRS